MSRYFRHTTHVPREGSLPVCMIISVCIHAAAGGVWYALAGGSDPGVCDAIGYVYINTVSRGALPVYTRNAAPSQERAQANALAYSAAAPEAGGAAGAPAAVMTGPGEKSGKKGKLRHPEPILDFDLDEYFPAEARSAGVTRKTIYVMIVVSAAGAVQSAAVLSKPDGYGFDRAALRLVWAMKFVPGSVDGKPVRMECRLPITFDLSE